MLRYSDSNLNSPFYIFVHDFFLDHMLKEVVKFMRHDRLVADDEDPIPEHFSDDEDNDDNDNDSIVEVQCPKVKESFSKTKKQTEFEMSLSKIG